MEMYVVWACDSTDKYYVNEENAKKACIDYINHYFNYSDEKEELIGALEEFEKSNSVSDICGYCKDYIEDLE